MKEYTEAWGELRAVADDDKRLFQAVLQRRISRAGRISADETLEVRQLETWETANIDWLKATDVSERCYHPAAVIIVDAVSLEEAIAQALPKLRTEVDRQWARYWQEMQAAKVMIEANRTEDGDAWVTMLGQMYIGWAARQGAKVTGRGDNPMTLVIENGWPYLYKEVGIHRLTRVSPFDESHRRITVFAAVDVAPGDWQDKSGFALDSVVRSYVMDPYKQVSDYKNGWTTEDVDAVLRGAIGADEHRRWEE